MVLDAGDLFAATKVMAEAQRNQVLSKAGLIARAYEYAGLDAMTIGDRDLAIGLRKLRDLEEEFHLPIVAANLRDMDGKILWPAFRVIVSGENRLAVIGAGAVGTSEDVQEMDTIVEVRKAVEEARGMGVDAVILLSARGTSGTEAILRTVTGIDLAIEAGNGRSLRSPDVVNGVPVVGAGVKNKMLGRLSLGLVEGGSGFKDPEGDRRSNMLRDSLLKRKPRLEEQLAAATSDIERQRAERALEMTNTELARLDRMATENPGTGAVSHKLAHSLVSLAKALDVDPVVNTWVEHTKESFSGDVISPKGVAPATLDKTRIVGPFVGAKQCASCHEAEYKQWSGTPHARAYLSLVKDKRHMDQDCYGCHVTGFGHPGGPESPKQVGYLGNVQCESCHGPGNKHMSAPAKDNIIKTPSEAKVCMGCHSDEQTNDRYNPKTYWPKVLHAAK